MRKIGKVFDYSYPATTDEVERLWDDIWEGELAERKDITRESFLAACAMADRSYVVRLDGRLAGICFVCDCDDRREMAFTKTRYLASERKIAFARNVGLLLADLAGAENEAAAQRRLSFTRPTRAAATGSSAPGASSLNAGSSAPMERSRGWRKGLIQDLPSHGRGKACSLSAPHGSSAPRLPAHGDRIIKQRQIRH